MTTQIDCYVDPACPFAWATSRWLTDIAQRRDDVTLTLRQMSLAVLNAEAIASGDLNPAMGHHMEVSRAGGRLLAAADSADFASLYSALGHRIHLQHCEVTVPIAREALSECGLDTELAAAVHDSLFDGHVESAHAAAIEAYGEPTGTPVVAIDGHAFLGPVITEIPTGAAADAVFNAVVVLAHSPAFAQMQRPRSGPPTLTKD